MGHDVGDELMLKIENEFGYKDHPPRHVTVLIIGKEKDVNEWETYLCYVKCYDSHPLMFKINDRLATRFNAKKHFVGEQGTIVGQWTNIEKIIKQRVGTSCDICKEFYDYAERNENDSFNCFRCREDPYSNKF